MGSIDFHLGRADTSIRLLDEQVGSPSMSHLPQTTNQAIVLCLKDLYSALELLKLEVLNLKEKED